MNSPISSGFVRGGGNTKRWQERLIVDNLEEPDTAEQLDAAKSFFTKDASESPTMLPTPQQMGFTGTTCTRCNSTRVVRTGHCETCQDCGETTACA